MAPPSSGPPDAARLGRAPASAEPAWDDLRLFLAVVAHGSLSAAARALGQSQPTLARRVRELEAQLGVPLFKRGANALALTEAGRAVLEAASPMAEAAAAVPGAAAAYRPDPDAPVRITATASVTMFLSRHARDLAAAAHPVEVAFLATRRRLELAASEADIALRMRHPPEGGDLLVRRIGRAAFTIYERAGGHAGAVIAPSEDPSLSRQAALVTAFAQRRGWPIAARIGDMPMRHQAIRAGLGAAVLPCWLGDSDPDLVRAAEPDAAFTEDVYLLTAARGARRPSVERVASAVAALFRRHADVLDGSRTG